MSVFWFNIWSFFPRTKPQKGERRTAQQVTPQVLCQTKMRRPQGILELVETTAVVLALQITLDVSEQLFDALESSIQSGDMVFCRQSFKQLGVPGLALGCLTSHVLQNSISGLVGELETAAKIDELCSDAGIGGVASVAKWRLGWARWVLNGLLARLALIGWNILAGGGFKSELEDLEGIGVFGGGGCHAEGVTRGKGNLYKVNK